MKNFKDLRKDSDYHKTLAPTKNSDEGIAALKKKHGMTHAQAKATIKRLMGEEKIDELNKSTLASYVKKASDDRAKNAYDVGKSGKMNTKGLKRRQGINRAVNKLTNEVLDTPQALDNYRKKAKTQSDKARNSATAKIVRGNNDISKEKNIIRKREKGLDMADKTANKQFRKSIGVGYSSKKESIEEKLNVSQGMGAWIDDFKKSDAPQFKGKNEKERRDMAIAAYMSAKRGGKNEAFDFRVNVDGFPEMFMSGNSPGEVKANLRALVKQPSMIKSVDRVTKHDKKKEFRKKAMANEGTMGDKPEWGTPEATKAAKKKTPGEQDEGFMDTVKKGFSYIMKNNNGKASTDTNRKSTSGSQNSKPSPSGGSIASKINFGGKYSK